MSRSRHAPEREPHVRSVSVSYASRTTWCKRESAWGQLVFASRGMLAVHTADGVWVVPPHRAMWVPPGLAHDVEMLGRVALHTVYLRAPLARGLPATCRMLDVSPLLRELLRRALRRGTLDRRVPAERHLVDVLLDELAPLPLGPVDLPTPRDPRAARAAAIVRAAPNARHPLAEVAREAGASARTLERLFRAETRLGFGAWRQRARLLRALVLLAEGTPVTNVALAVGYESPSAFVAAFRRALGATPGRYFTA
jgi:AraC-like DNA-binding protein